MGRAHGLSARVMHSHNARPAARVGSSLIRASDGEVGGGGGGVGGDQGTTHIQVTRGKVGQRGQTVSQAEWRRQNEALWLWWFQHCECERLKVTAAQGDVDSAHCVLGLHKHTFSAKSRGPS